MSRTGNQPAGMSLRHSILGVVVIQLVAINGAEAARAEETTTVYIGRHFEVRDHDQPVKYAFNGETRVARITGSVSSPERLQRLRLQAGWNSVSLAVTATNLAGQLRQFAQDSAPLVQALYQWQPATRFYTSVSDGETVAAGVVLWLKARTNAVVAVVGAYAEPDAVVLGPGGGYVSSPGLETWSPALPVGVTMWKYDARAGVWGAGFSGDLATVSDVPVAVAPGDAIYVHSPEAVELPIPDPAQRVLFYHPDHLGSVTALTDAAGDLAEETAYYPFGAVRHEERRGDMSAHYGFAQKERDPESGLQYIGHRFLHPILGRWISTDPLLEQGGGPNPYAYVKQSPLQHHDPDGAEITMVKGLEKGVTTYTIKMQAVLIDVSSGKFTQQEIAAYAQKLKSSIEQSFQGKKGNIRWSTTVDLRVINNYSQIGDCDHVFRIMDKTRGDAAGSTVRGTKVMDIAVHTLRRPTPDQVDRSNPANKHYTWENYISPEGTGTHEFGHSAGLPHVHGKANLMQTGDERQKDNKTVTLEQIEIMYKAYKSGKLNQRDDELNRITGRR